MEDGQPMTNIAGLLFNFIVRVRATTIKSQNMKCLVSLINLLAKSISILLLFLLKDLLKFKLLLLEVLPKDQPVSPNLKLLRNTPNLIPTTMVPFHTMKSRSDLMSLLH